MASVFKPAGSKRWYINWTDEHGRRRKKVGATDKGVTLRIARDLENKAALKRDGLIDPKADAYRDHEAKLLTTHLDDFRRSLDSKGGTTRHPAVTRSRAAKLFEMAGIKRLSEIAPSKVMEALGRMRAEGSAAETINHHVRAVKGFARWLWRDGRTRDHLLEHLATSRTEGDRRRVRRALTTTEAAAVVGAARGGPDFERISGVDRAWAYELALATGFRARELATLTPERFRLNATPPTAEVSAGYTKNKRAAVQPIPARLASRLAPWLATKEPGRPVFPLPKRTADMIRCDLDAAGVPFETPEGVADFHSLRGVYISDLIASGASVKAVQVLARHSTPTLTIGIYAKARPDNLTSAVVALPDLATQVEEDGPATGRKPPATKSTTGPMPISPQVVSQERINKKRALDLKSFPGEPGCGFDSHRWYLR